MEYLQVLSMAAFASFYAVGAVAPATLVIYLVLRARDAKQERHDPQLGLKLALNALLTYSIAVAVMGASDILAETAAFATGQQIRTPSFGRPTSSRLTESKFLTPAFRTALGALIAGLLLSLFFGRQLAKRTNTNLFPACSRAFTGFRAISFGFAFSISTTLMLVSILEGSDTSMRLTVRFFCQAAVAAFAFAIEIRRLDVASTHGYGPGVTLCCNHCGLDLRDKSPETNCPECNLPLAIVIRRAVARVSQPPATTASPPKPHPLD